MISNPDPQTLLLNVKIPLSATLAVYRPFGMIDTDAAEMQAELQAVVQKYVDRANLTPENRAEVPSLPENGPPARLSDGLPNLNHYDGLPVSATVYQVFFKDWERDNWHLWNTHRARIGDKTAPGAPGIAGHETRRNALQYIASLNENQQGHAMKIRAVTVTVTITPEPAEDITFDQACNELSGRRLADVSPEPPEHIAKMQHARSCLEALYMQVAYTGGSAKIIPQAQLDSLASAKLEILEPFSEYDRECLQEYWDKDLRGKYPAPVLFPDDSERERARAVWFVTRGRSEVSEDPIAANRPPDLSGEQMKVIFRAVAEGFRRTMLETGTRMLLPFSQTDETGSQEFIRAVINRTPLSDVPAEYWHMNESDRAKIEGFVLTELVGAFKDVQGKKEN